MEVIFNETKEREGNDCKILRTAIVGYVPSANTYVVTKLQWYLGSWTPRGVTSDCENYESEERALREAEAWLYA